MSKQKQVHRSVRNEDYHRAMVEIRRSSAASKHVPKARKGTRTEQKHRAMRDW
ncbi:hypothetical protein ACWG8W_06005 [Citricoccus zhacaiensis]